MSALLAFLLVFAFTGTALGAGATCEMTGGTAAVPIQCSAANAAGCALETDSCAGVDEDDLWQIGTGVNESIRIDITPGVTAGDSYAVTWQGQTVNVVKGANTAGACSNSANVGWLSESECHQDGVRLQVALETIVGKGNVYVETFGGIHTNGAYTIHARGNLACQPLTNLTCAGGCTTSNAVNGVVGDEGHYEFTGNWTQGTNAVAGLEIRCNSSVELDAGDDGQSITLGPAGLNTLFGATIINSPNFVQNRNGQSPAITSDKADETALWTIETVTECLNADCSTNADQRQLDFPSDGLYNLRHSLSSPVGVDPSVSEGIVLIDDSNFTIWFPPGGNANDEGYAYDGVSAVTTNDSISNETIIIETQGSDNTEMPGYVTGVHKAWETTVVEALEIGDRSFTLTDLDRITIDGQFAGQFAKIGNYWYLICDTDTDVADTVTLCRNEGVREPSLATATIQINQNHWDPGERFLIVNNVEFLSSTPETTNAGCTPLGTEFPCCTGVGTGTCDEDAEDSVWLIQGDIDLDYVKLKEMGEVRWKGAGQVGTIWYQDGLSVGGDTNGFEFQSPQVGAYMEWYIATGGPEECSEAEQNCNHASQQNYPGVDMGTFTNRHTVDDAQWIGSGSATGIPYTINIGTLRCQHKMTTIAHTGSCLEPSGNNLGTYKIGTMEVKNASTWNSSDTTAMCTQTADSAVHWIVDSLFVVQQPWGGTCNLEVNNALITSNPPGILNQYNDITFKNTKIEHVTTHTNGDDPCQREEHLGETECHTVMENVWWHDINLTASISADILRMEHPAGSITNKNVTFRNIVVSDSGTHSASGAFIKWPNTVGEAGEHYFIDGLMWINSDVAHGNLTAAAPIDALMHYDSTTSPANAIEVKNVVCVNGINANFSVCQRDDVGAADAFNYIGDGPVFVNWELGWEVNEQANLPANTLYGFMPGMALFTATDTTNFTAQASDWAREIGGLLSANRRGFDRAGACHETKWHRWNDIPVSQTCIDFSPRGSVNRSGPGSF